MSPEGACERRDHGSVDFARDALDGLEVARRGDREAGFDHIHAQTRELLRDLKLLLRVQRDAGDCSPSRSVVSR